MSSSPQVFKPVFDRLYESFNVPDSADRPDSDRSPLRPAGGPGDRRVRRFESGIWAGRVSDGLVEAVCRVLGDSPAAFVRRFEPDRDGAPLQPLVHRWTRGPDFVALLVDSEAHARRTTVPSNARLPQDWRLETPTLAPRSRHFRASPGASRCGRHMGGCPNSRGLLLFRPAVDRRRVQAAEPVPPMDGPAGRGRSWRLDDGGSEAAGRSARYPHHPNGEVPSSDPTGHTRLEDGGGDHRVPPMSRPGRSRALRLRPVPPEHDGRLRIRSQAKGLAVPAAWLLPAPIRPKAKGQRPIEEGPGPARPK